MYTIKEVVDANKKLLGKEDVLGDRVIVVGNEKPAWMGRIIGFVPVSKSNNLWPLIRNESGEEFAAGGVLLPGHADLLDMLHRLDVSEAFELAGRIKWLVTAYRDIESMRSHDLEPSEEPPPVKPRGILQRLLGRKGK